jgi:hypothetical protein
VEYSNRQNVATTGENTQHILRESCKKSKKFQKIQKVANKFTKVANKFTHKSLRQVLRFTTITGFTSDSAQKQSLRFPVLRRSTIYGSLRYAESFTILRRFGFKFQTAILFPRLLPIFMISTKHFSGSVTDPAITASSDFRKDSTKTQPPTTDSETALRSQFFVPFWFFLSPFVPFCATLCYFVLFWFF